MTSTEPRSGSEQGADERVGRDIDVRRTPDFLLVAAVLLAWFAWGFMVAWLVKS